MTGISPLEIRLMQIILIPHTFLLRSPWQHISRWRAASFIPRRGSRRIEGSDRMPDLRLPAVKHFLLPRPLFLNLWAEFYERPLSPCDLRRATRIRVTCQSYLQHVAASGCIVSRWIYRIHPKSSFNSVFRNLIEVENIGVEKMENRYFPSCEPV